MISLQLFQGYKWKRVAMVYAQYNPICSHGEDQLRDMFLDSRNGISLEVYARLRDDSSDDEIRRVLHEHKKTSRSELDYFVRFLHNLWYNNSDIIHSESFSNSELFFFFFKKSSD